MSEDQPRPQPPDPEEAGLARSHLDFPVVGIGASAGGLAALRAFFGAMPPDSGMAFVVILHLSPKHESAAAEVLQRVTAMPVQQVREPMAIEANRVYVIPPLNDLTMNDGVLRLQPTQRLRSVTHAAVDIFFRTLATVHRERGVGVVLSGSGSDGAVGISRLKEVGGITIAQSPEDAEFESMPSAAIATGAVDIVLPVAEIPPRLVDIWRNMRRIEMPQDVAGATRKHPPPDPDSAQRAEVALADIMTVLRLQTRHDFRHYKRATVLRRIERRLQVNALPDIVAYGEFLRANPEESAALLQDLLISVTNFFRDREAFEALERDVIPTLFEHRRPHETVRVWVAGCATGEEAYSIAILLREFRDRNPNAPDFQVFATDIDERAIAVARAGLYPGAVATDVAPMRLRQCFSNDSGGFRVIKAIREKVLFAAHNVLRDPPFSRLDLVCCRNLLIYLERRAQSGILDMFRFALRPNGFLFLGVSESADAAIDAFAVHDKKNRIFRATAGNATSRGLPLIATPAPATDLRPTSGVSMAAERRPSTVAELHRRSLEQLLPPSVLIDAQHNILHLSEGAGAFIEPASGPLSPNLLANVSPELRLELRTALYAAAQSHSPVDVRNIAVERGGRPRRVHLSVRPFRSDHGDQLALIVFEESGDLPSPLDPPAVDQEKHHVVARLELDVRLLKEQLQETIEASETSTEELRASNEELQAINEELRSATEELETSKEELQSTNEELTTVNYELKTKVEEADRINDDLQNLIGSTDIATIFVNRGLQIKRFTPQASQLFNLIPSDIGRSLLDITHRFDYPSLAEDAQQAFLDLRVIEHPLRTRDGRHFLARFLPYRTSEDKIVGAVLTFVDVTALHEARSLAKRSEELLLLAAEATRDFAIITTNEAGIVTAWNPGAVRLFQWREEEIIGRPADLIFTEDDREKGVPEQEMRTARERGRAEDERWHLRKDGTTVYCSGVMTPLRHGDERGYAKIARDMTQQKQLAVSQGLLLAQEKSVRQQAQAASTLKDEFLAVMSHELKHPLNLIHVNAELLRRTPESRTIPTIERASEAILRAAASQAKIIDDLLDLSRARTGKMNLRMTNVALDDVVAAIVQAARVDARDHEITLQFASKPLIVRGDQVRIEQIVWNLLSNAVKFTPAGGRIDVRLAYDADAQEASLTVADTGRGIEAQFLPRIFDMFSQEGVSRGPSERGLGIGLALVSDLVGAHGGRVSADSNGINKGAVFTIVLPLLAVGTLDDPASLSPEQHPLSGLRVLLVDDSRDTLTIFSSLLQLEGARVDTADGGAEALAAMAGETFDLLISDIGMPGMTGYEMMQALVRDGRKPRASLALTGYGREVDIARARQAGFDMHMSKPVSIDTINHWVAELRRDGTL